MTKKRKRYPDLNQKLERPWCYYCERDFDDLKILISHQKAKHFKCDRCGRRLNTAGGLNVHMNQVHKETLTQVENAIPGRAGLEIEIFGMEGVPEEAIDAHTNTVTSKHFEEEAERARVTGNPVRGQFDEGNAAAPKRVKVKENVEEIVARAAKYRHDKVNGLLPVQPVAAPLEHPAVTPPQPVAGFGAPPVLAPGSQFPPQYPPVQVFPPGAPGFVVPPGIPPYAQGPSPPNVGLPQRPPYGYPPPGQFPVGQNGIAPPPHSAMSASVDELITHAAASAAPAGEAGAEKKSKKERNIKLIFFDDTISPEEKMAALPRYASAVRT